MNEAKKELDTANLKLEEFLESGGGSLPGNDSVKAAGEALKEAKKALEDARQQAADEKRQAKRNLEDASAESAKNAQAEISRIQIVEKQKQFAMLEAVKKDSGKITAQMDGTVTQVQLEVGQRTGESAAFLLSATSEGMCFTTEISKEDAVYVIAGDTVTLRTVDKEYEELSVVSVEPSDEEGKMVKVTIFVPKDTLSSGESADMELTKTSGEYGVILPLSAIHTENEGYFVYVRTLEDTVLGGQYVAQRMDVTVAEKNEACAALTGSSLSPDSQVIVSSDKMISVGERVRLKEKEGADE